MEEFNFYGYVTLYYQAESNMNDLISEYQQYQEVLTRTKFKGLSLIILNSNIKFKGLSLIILLSCLFLPFSIIPVQATIDDDDCFDAEEEDQDQD